MPFFGMNPVEQENALFDAQQNSYIPQPDAAGFFDNSLTALPRGLATSARETGLLYGDAATPFVNAITGPIDQTIGTNLTGDYDQWKKDNFQYLNSAAPNQQSTGWLGNALYGLGEMAIPAAIGAAEGLPAGPAGIAAGAISNVAAVSGYSKTRELESQGVDAATATAVGVITGGVNAAMFELPGGKIFGSSIIPRIATNAVSMAALGSASRGATSTILDAAGYHDMAASYRWNDKLAIFNDILIGGLTGIHEHPTNEVEKIENIEAQLPSDTDAGLFAGNVNNLEIDSAPGIPIDMETRNAHVDTMGTDNMANFLMGDDIDTSKVEEHGRFLAKPENTEVAAAFEQSMRDQIEQRDQKLQEVQGKHDTALADFNTSNDLLTKANSDLDQASSFNPKELSPGDRLSLVDADSGARLKQIESDLQQPNLTTKQVTDLQAEQKLVTEGSRVSEKQIKDAIKGKVKENKGEIADLTAKRDEIAKDVEKKQRTVDRYKGEVDKRRERLECSKRNF